MSCKGLEKNAHGIQKEVKRWSESDHSEMQTVKIRCTVLWNTMFLQCFLELDAIQCNTMQCFLELEVYSSSSIAINILHCAYVFVRCTHKKDPNGFLEYQVQRLKKINLCALFQYKQNKTYKYVDWPCSVDTFLCRVERKKGIWLLYVRPQIICNPK